MRILTAKLQSVDPYLRSLYLFNIISMVGGSIYGMYYGVFLYKHTSSLATLATDALIGAIGTWVGYLIGTVILKRFGYGVTIKLAFGLLGAVAIGTAFAADHIAEWYLLLAILRSIPAGLNAAAMDTMMLREVKHTARSNFLQLVLGLEFLGTLLFPLLLGAIITTSSGYQITFALGGLVFLSALLVPVKVPKPKLQFNMRDMLDAFRRPLYLPAAVSRTVGTGFNQMNGLMIMIIPYLLLQNELKMGALNSLVALFAAASAILMRKVKQHRKLKLGYAAHLGRGLAGIGFVLSWSPPLLLIWQMVCKLATPVHDPLQQSYDIHTDSLILGKDLKKQAMQFNVLNNTLSLIGSIVAFGLFLLVISSGPAQQLGALKVLIISYFGWRVVSLTVSKLINQAAVDNTTVREQFWNVSAYLRQRFVLQPMNKLFS